MLKDIFKICKINHYIKNAIIFLPLIFSMNILNFKLYPKCILIFLGFCFISSAVYIMNDIIDIEYDKKHPVKCNRPIASGSISKKAAVIICILLFVMSFLTVHSLNSLCALMIGLYFLLNFFYSVSLKNIILVDAACIATGFIFRIVAGCFAISVLPSPLVILMTFFVSMFFTFIKRKLELEVVKNNILLRKSISDIDINTANKFILINAVLSIAFYITYSLDNNTILYVGSKYFYLTGIPFTLIIFRLLLLSDFLKDNDDPVIFLERDKTLLFFIIFYLFILIVIYFI